MSAEHSATTTTTQGICFVRQKLCIILLAALLLFPFLTDSWVLTLLVLFFSDFNTLANGQLNRKPKSHTSWKSTSFLSLISVYVRAEFSLSSWDVKEWWKREIRSVASFSSRLFFLRNPVPRSLDRCLRIDISIRCYERDLVCLCLCNRETCVKNEESHLLKICWSLLSCLSDVIIDVQTIGSSDGLSIHLVKYDDGTAMEELKLWKSFWEI